MLQYILNTTTVWLISLIVFDVFLRRESFHNYNRFYLLFTFLLGACLPLVHWPDTELTHQSAAIDRPLQQVIAVKQNIVTAPIHASTTINWPQWMLISYCIGACFASCLLIIEIVKLAKAYHSGKRSVLDNWQLIETGNEHAPFSFSNTLFVSSRNQYNDAEWAMILAHESRHTSLFHIADLLLLQLARILLWFHPLVYLYNKRLLLVHEYQADAIATQHPKVYGHFLLQQALSGSSPLLAHSFNRSPIKNRILMLTRTSSAAAKSKLLVFIPVVFICIVCCSQNSFSGSPKKIGNTCVYRGNTVEFLAPKLPDSYLYTDEATGKTARKPISWPMPPIKVNGNKIYDPQTDKDVTPPIFKSNYKSLAGYLIRNAEKEICTLADGDYLLLVQDVVINDKGSIVYFDNQGVMRIGGDIKEQSAQSGQINNKINDLINDAPSYEPARSGNTAVAFRIGDVSSFTYGYNYGWQFTVKNHRIIWDITSETMPPNKK